MGQAFQDAADDFIEALADTLDVLSGGADHRSECVIEASNIVAAFVDADGRHSTAELDAWLESIGTRLSPPVVVSTEILRSDDTFGGRARWLDQPSTMFDLLVNADANDGQRRANLYYTHSMSLAHATAAIDLVPSPAELAAVDRFRTLLLRTMDAHGVPRPGRPSGTAPAVAIAGAPADQVLTSDEAPTPAARSLEELLAELDALVGLDDVKEEVRRLTSLLRIQELRAARALPTIDTSRHLVFSGNPGTGKTTVARLLSQIFRSLGVVSTGHLVETDRSDLVAGYVGQTATRTRAVLESARGGTLLIDEAYALARGGDDDFGREAIDTIVKFMEDHREDLSVIAAGYPTEMQELVDSNPGLKSRFTRTIHFPDYSTEELVAIFVLISSIKEYHLDDLGTRRLREVIEAEPRGKGFGNGRFVRNVFEAAVGHHAVRLAETPDVTDEQLTTLTADDIHRVD